MALLGQKLGHPAHPGEDRDDLLGMVDDVIRLGTDFHEHVGHGRILLAEPGMLRIQLVAEDETDGVGHDGKGGLRSRLASDLP